MSESKYVQFVKRNRKTKSAKTDRWYVRSILSDEVIGEIEWKTSWRRYVFLPYENTLYDSKCLTDIGNFMDHEMEMRRLRKLPRPDQCFPCQKEDGGNITEGCHTVYMAHCPKCGKLEAIHPSRDFNWPERKAGLWD